MPRKASGIIVLVAALALTGAGCGGDDEEEPATESATEANPFDASEQSEEADSVAIADFRFIPQAVSAPVGSEITFTNSDVAPHTATADDGSFDTGRLAQRDEGTIKLAEAGEFKYFCDFHPFMRGTIEVTE